jgi:site-specific DNA-methyltransferase (adenine-specific)
LEVNRLILGDNLDILKSFDSDSIDLIYLDPPFFSNRNYEVIWGDAGEIRSFQDRWSGGMDHYIAWLKERVEQMHRILKPTGSIFLHCDWHADAYIRVDILDKIFGYQNFKNDIVWFYKTRPQSKKYFGRKHDTIFFYTKSGNYTFNWQDVTRSLSDSTIGKYRLKDEAGRLYRLQGRGITGSPIRSAKDVEPKWEITNPELVVRDYLDEKIGVALEDWWDIETINQNSKELIGYPTQKPEELLERIIRSASNEGDIVLDPFVGGGTTVAVADKLNRKWIGIDQSVQAVKVTELRLDNQRDLFSSPFTVHLHKYDYDTLRFGNAFEFESWIVQQFGGVNNAKQRGDFGLDGKMPDNTPIQVKRSDNIGRNVVDNFIAAAMRSDKKLFDKNTEDKKPVGYIIAFSFGKGAIEEVARLKVKEGIIIELVTVEKIVPIAKKPSIKVEFTELGKDEKGVREIQMLAFGESEAGIEFYSWNLNYNHEKGFKADIMIDKEGKQIVKFKGGGDYNVAVKVVDNDGLESIEVVKLKVNGTVTRD